MTNPTDAWTRAVESLKSTTRAHWRRIFGLSLCFSSGLGVGAWTLFAEFYWSLSSTLVSTLLIMALSTLALLAQKQVVTLYRAASDRRALSQLFRTLEPESGTSVESAVEFASQSLSSPERPTQGDFKTLHVSQTLALLDSQKWSRRLKDWTSSIETRVQWATVAALATSLTIVILADEGRSRSLTWLRGETQAMVVEESLVTDISILTRYPDYTKLPPRKVEGSDGTIEGLRGSLVRLKVQSLREDYLPILLPATAQGDKAPESLKATQLEEGHFQFEFSLNESFQYRFGLTDQNGLDLIESRDRQVLVKPDMVPNVSIESQGLELELRDQDSLPIRWRADDDFGIDRVDVALLPSGAQSPITIRLDSPGTAERSERGQWIFTPKAHLNSGVEFLELWIKAVDNDATNGGNIGKSQRLRLTILSARRQHQKLLKEADKLHMAMVDLLAIEWEEDLSQGATFVSQGRYVAAASTLDASMKSFTDALAEDPFAKVGLRETFANVHENISQSLRERQELMRRKAAPQQKASPRDYTIQTQARTRLENDIIYLDDLLSLQRIDDLRATTDELLTQRDELQNLLQAYRENQDPQMKEELADRIERLRQQMNQLLQEMAAIRKSLPGEYRNLEASSALQVEDQLSRINEAIAEGDLEAAFEELDSISGMLEQMQRSLDQAEEDYGDERYDELREDVDQVMSDLSEIEQKQEALNQATEELYENAKQRHFEQTKTTEAELQEKLLKEIRAALLSLDSATQTQLLESGHRQFGVTRENLIDMELATRESLLNQVANTFADATRSWSSFSHFAQSRLSRFPQSEQTILKSVIADVDEHFEEIARLLESLNPEIDFRDNPKNQSALDKLEQEQREIQEQAQAMQDKLGELGAELPIFGNEASEGWSKAQREMQDASGAFKKDRLNQGKVHGRRALEEIRSFKQGLERAAQDGAGGSGPKIPLPFGARANPGQGKGGKGLRQNSEEVMLPQGDEGRRSIRDDILEAAKQEAPEGYEEAVRQYYEELIR